MPLPAAIRTQVILPGLIAVLALAGCKVEVDRSQGAAVLPPDVPAPAPRVEQLFDAGRSRGLDPAQPLTLGFDWSVRDRAPSIDRVTRVLAESGFHLTITGTANDLGFEMPRRIEAELTATLPPAQWQVLLDALTRATGGHGQVHWRFDQSPG